MKKIILLLFIVSNLVFAKIPYGSKVIYYKTNRLDKITRKLEEISKKHIILDWKIGDSTTSDKNGYVNHEYFFIVFIQ